MHRGGHGATRLSPPYNSATPCPPPIVPNHRWWARAFGPWLTLRLSCCASNVPRDGCSLTTELPSGHAEVPILSGSASAVGGPTLVKIEFGLFGALGIRTV